MTGSRFRVIDGGPAPKPKREHKPTEHFPWECRACFADIGHATRMLIKVRDEAVEDPKLRISGGRDRWVCATCLARGKVTPQTA